MPDGSDVLQRFGAATREWFRSSFAAPTPAQVGAWDAVSRGQHSLVVAPTGSGKTLAAFLWALDQLASTPPPADRSRRCRVLYVSPLKALAVDVERNLRAPLTGIRHTARRLGLPEPAIEVAVRSGDTPADARRKFARTPADVLITTPESLFLLLTSQARDALRGVETVIIDEVHAVAGTKRGAHLGISLERLDALVAGSDADGDSTASEAPRRIQRIGLSATVRPVEEVARFLGGSAPVTVVNPPYAKEFDLKVVVPVEDMGDLGQVLGPEEQFGAAAGPERRSSIWPHVEERVADLIEQQRSTLVFANSRRLAERLTARLNEISSERLGERVSGVVGEERAAREANEEPNATISSERLGDTDGADGADDLPVAGSPAQIMAQSGASKGAPGLLARAHHGSVSKEQRALIEDDLKSGRLPCVVATSSLELGIDMGAVDLVVQVEAPPSVASGLQRVGRAGHQVGAVSRGVIFPKYRGDLVATAVVTERMRSGLIEATRIPTNPLDVLAQQIVSASCMDTWQVDELYTLIRRAAPFQTLPRSAFDTVLDMLSGRYPSDEFAELRPRLVWDRVAGTLTGRPGAQRLAVTSGGTIPDRGLFGVFLVGEKNNHRVGELDEEMVYESRVGDVFTLGASSWRIEDITHDRVLVSPAPGQPGRLPFWKGDTLGRPAELGRAIGGYVRELGRRTPDEARTQVRQAGLDEWAADNLVSYLEEQRQATRHVPDDRTILVERFRDELGDWRICVHTPFGGGVHAPWALAIGARLRERYGVDVQSVHADDGIVLRIPDTEDSPPGADLAIFEPDEIEQLVTDEIGGSALFAARFRECAARALLLPRRDPRRRTPLWQQRQRSAQLLEVASKYASFPIVLEAVRECLQDVYDLPGLVELLRDIAARRIRVVEVETNEPSPFAKSLTFGYIAAFMYEGDAPLAERKAAALALDRSLLAELLGQTELRDLLDPEVMARTEAELQRLVPERRCRGPEDVADLLRLLGPLSTEEVAARCTEPAYAGRWLSELESTRRVLRHRGTGEHPDGAERWAAVEDASRLRDALGVPLPVGLPEAFAEPVADPLGDLIARYARTHGPFHAGEVAARFGLGVAVVNETLRRLAGQGRVVEGTFRSPDEPRPGTASHVGGPEAYGTEWCDAGVLRTLRRRSLAALRSEVEPVEPAALARFLPAWQHVGGRLRGTDGVLRVIEQLAGCAVPASALERLVLASRVADYSPAMLDELTATGEVVWAGHGTLPGTDGWISLHLADSADLTLPQPDPEFEPGPLHQAVLDVLASGGGFFFRPLSDAVQASLRTNAPTEEPADDDPAGDGRASKGVAVDDQSLVTALWDLVWAGHLTGDTLAPLRTLLGSGSSAHRSRSAPPRSRFAGGRSSLRRGRPAMPSRTGPPTASGRWSLLPDREPDPTRRAHAAAEALLDRHGVLTRGAVMAERVPGGFAAVYQVLSAFEESGRCRRGYFVAGLGAAQFGAPGAVDRLRASGQSGDSGEQSGDQPDLSQSLGRPSSDRSARTVVLAATDPANPYGAALSWPARPDQAPEEQRGHRPGRKAGALVVLVDGHLILYVERGGRTLLTWSDDLTDLQPAVDALALAVRDGVLGKLSVERVDGEAILRPHGHPEGASPLATALASAGFHVTPRGLRLRG
ncbi:ATP-dependent helicase [Actinopolymorpha alba]|uniref:ATP-dependent helicase n=1 Tax=Actinopolymorpha alba TaxID=533267 RepID=UPI00037A6A5C|nr:ATP-dependent helicase [Actinopolymorpha alba]